MGPDSAEPGAHRSGGDNSQRFSEDFARALRDRRVSLRTAAAKSHWGKTTIASAGRGPGLPNRDLVRDVLTSVGLEDADVQAWLRRYDSLVNDPALPADLYEFPSAAAAGQVDGAEQPMSRSDTRRSSSSGRRWLFGGGLVLIAAVIVVIVVVTRLGRTDSGPVDHQVAASSSLVAGLPHDTVVVQNKVAVGPSTLQEDTTPEYLSTRPVSHCASTGCNMSGTDMWSGATVTVVCHIEGELMTNANVTSRDIKENPNVAASALWYRAIWPDGRQGYVSEVYLAPSYRGGLDLPQC